MIQEMRLVGAETVAGGYTLSGDAETAKIWAVPAPGEPGLYLLLPGYQAILNWSAHFAGQRLTTAQELFGAGFELAEGGGSGLAVHPPAPAGDRGGGRLEVVRRGRLSGFRS